MAKMAMAFKQKRAICRILKQEADMKDKDQVEAVIRMQDYIHAHIHEALLIEDVCAVSGYSQRHALRVFRTLLHISGICGCG